VTEKVFISHTSGRSTKFSACISDWISSSPIAGIIEPWHSGDQNSLVIGTYAHARIVSAAQQCTYCISIVTEENLSEPWLNFEAGLFFAKDELKPGVKPIITLLCGDLLYKDIGQSHPLQPIYSAKPSNKGNLLSLLKAMRDSLGNTSVKDISIEKYINSSTTDELISDHERIFSKVSSKMVDAKNGLVF
jgi:hypothetical protein